MSSRYNRINAHMNSETAAEACTRHGKAQARQGPGTGWEMWAQSPPLTKKLFVVFFNESHWGSQTILQDRTHAQEQLVSTKQTVVFLYTFSSVLLCLGTLSYSSSDCFDFCGSFSPPLSLSLFCFVLKERERT